MGSLFAKYIVDTSSFTSLQRTYPRDVLPGVWTLVDKLSRNGVLLSVEDVFEELKGQDDEVFKWAKKNKSIFLPLDEAIQVQARAILAERPNLVDLKRSVCNRRSRRLFLRGRHRGKTERRPSEGKDSRCVQALQHRVHHGAGHAARRGLKTQMTSQGGALENQRSELGQRGRDSAGEEGDYDKKMRRPASS